MHLLPPLCMRAKSGHVIPVEHNEPLKQILFVRRMSTIRLNSKFYHNDSCIDAHSPPRILYCLNTLANLCGDRDVF